MGPAESSDIILGILYATGAILLLVTSYMLFIKRFKRNKLEAINDVTLSTSRYNIYHQKTQFLIEVTRSGKVELNLLDDQEQMVTTLLNEELEIGETVIDFDPANYSNGIYYLSLKSTNASILRKIKIDKETGIA